MSLLGKKWVIQNEQVEQNLFKRLLTNRGITDETQMQRFLYPERKIDFHDPFLMKDMQTAVERIFAAIKNEERIMIFGDYDVDGITGSAILLRTLKLLGAQISCKLPSRLKDGYGLKTKFIDTFAEAQVRLIITVDNGISCASEVEYAAQKNIDVIVSDHHTVPAVLPKAVALLHPKLPGCGYPFSELTGSAVALKLAQALVAKAPEFLPNHPALPTEEFINDLLDLACMGTIADLGELTGENRYIVKEGLKRLTNTRWPGLSRLKEKAGVKGNVTTEMVGFHICPRINAAGRMSDPVEALRLLIHEGNEAETLAHNLDVLNRERQDLMQTLIEVAEGEILSQQNNSLLVVANDSFHGGIIGLIAARLCEKYSKPAIALEKRGEMFIGSCRSIPGVNIVEALTILQKNAGENPILAHFGGHPGAAGFDMPIANHKRFFDDMNEIVAQMMIDFEPSPIISLDTILREEELTFESLNIIRLLEPFGMGNSAPVFACHDLAVHEVLTMGKEKNHLKIRLRANGTIIDAVGFKLGHLHAQLKNVQRVSLACELDDNEWNGTTKIQLKIKDVKC